MAADDYTVVRVTAGADLLIEGCRSADPDRVFGTRIPLAAITDKMSDDERQAVWREALHLHDNPPDNYSSFLVTEYGKGASSRAVSQARKKAATRPATSGSTPADSARSTSPRSTARASRNRSGG